MSKRRMMTIAEHEAAIAISPRRVTYLPASVDKRFARQIYDAATSLAPQITEAQSANLFRLRHKYRRQIPASVPCANPEPQQAASGAA